MWFFILCSYYVIKILKINLYRNIGNVYVCMVLYVLYILNFNYVNYICNCKGWYY